MIRYYLDSNVYRYANTGSKNYKKEIRDVLTSLKEKILFTYSDSHLDDLSTSEDPFLTSDLESMEEFVHDNLFRHDIMKKDTSCLLVIPKEAYKDKDYSNNSISSNVNPFDTVEKLLDDIQQDDSTGLIKILADSLKQLMSIPMLDMSSIINNENIDDSTREMINKMFPSPKEYMSIKDVAENIFPYGTLIYNDKKELTKFRKFSRKYVNSNDISFEKWGLDFIAKFRESKIGKDFNEFVESTFTDKEKMTLFDKFVRIYAMLEIIGVDTEKNKNGRLKEFNYRSLHLDASHAYYASYSDYLVSHDKGMQVKAFITYSLLGIKTKVLTLEEFINSKSLILSNEEDLDSYLKSLEYDLDNSILIASTNNIVSHTNTRTYTTGHNYFNYFNRIQVIDFDEEKAVVLFCDRSKHSNWFMYREIELLSQKLINVFGMDDDNLGEYVHVSDAEKNTGNDRTIRKWTINNHRFELSLSFRKTGNRICFSLFVPSAAKRK